jgi:hypothetical protein
MIDREELNNIENILSLTNDKYDTKILYNILTALKENDNVTFLDIIYSTIYPNIDISLLKNVYRVIKEYPDLEKDLLDSFSNNQYISKTALLNAVERLDILSELSTVAIWGSWYGSILIPALSHKVKKITSIDLDSKPLQIAKNRLFNNYKNIDYVCDDIFKTCRKSYIETNLIINTSCEHMLSMKEWPWFGPGAILEDNIPGKDPKISSNCWFAFQSNNMFGIEGHINCVNSLEEFENQLPERAKVHFREEIKDTRGTRYMLVGKFMPL